MMRIRQNPRWKPRADGLEILFREAVAREDLGNQWVLDAVRLAGRDPGEDTVRWARVRAGAWGVGIVTGILALGAVEVFVDPGIGSGRVYGLAGICAGGVAMAVWYAVCAGPSRWFERARGGCCRRCGYDLGGVTAGLRVVVDDTSRDLGPVNCPECGQVWPLVFPQ